MLCGGWGPDGLTDSVRGGIKIVRSDKPKGYRGCGEKLYTVAAAAV